MRTTIRIDESIMSAAKKTALLNGLSLTALIEEALKVYLAQMSNKKGKQQSARLPTFKGKGLLPGVDLDDSAQLLELLEDGNDPL